MQNDLPVQGIGELTEREREILKLVATGTSNKDIAHQLFISSNTVKVHLRNIFAKIGVTSRTEAAVYAIHNGLLAQESPTLEANIPASSPPLILGGKRRSLFVWIAISVILVLAGIITYMVIKFRTSTSAVNSIPTAPPRWHELASLPTARRGLAVAVYENKIYGIGGESVQGITGVVEQYDVATDSWRTLAPKPVPVTDVKAAVIGGQVYVPGGRLPSGSMTNIFESYDPGRDQWQRQAPLPVAISGYSLVAFEGRLYLFGGWDGKSYLDTVLVYAPGENTWSKRTPMPTRRAFSGAAVVEGKILVVGGYDGRNALAVTEEYLPDHDTWSKRAFMPAGRYAMGVASIADILYIVGGTGESDSILQPMQYLYQQNQWQAFENPFPYRWSYLGMVPLQTQIYAMGGDQNGSSVSKNLSYQAIYTIILPFIK